MAVSTQKKTTDEPSAIIAGSSAARLDIPRSCSVAPALDGRVGVN
jgi:hypothetical protein